MRKKVLSQQSAAIYDLASIIRQQKLRLNISQEKVVFYCNVPGLSHFSCSDFIYFHLSLVLD